MHYILWNGFYSIKCVVYGCGGRSARTWHIAKKTFQTVHKTSFRRFTPLIERHRIGVVRGSGGEHGSQLAKIHGNAFLVPATREIIYRRTARSVLHRIYSRCMSCCCLEFICFINSLGPTVISHNFFRLYFNLLRYLL